MSICGSSHVHVRHSYARPAYRPSMRMRFIISFTSHGKYVDYPFPIKAFITSVYTPYQKDPRPLPLHLDCMQRWTFYHCQYNTIILTIINGINFRFYSHINTNNRVLWTCQIECYEVLWQIIMWRLMSSIQNHAFPRLFSRNGFTCKGWGRGGGDRGVGEENCTYCTKI